MLRFDCQVERLGVVEIVAGPQIIEKIEPQISSKRFLDYLPITLAGASSSDLHGPQHVLIDRHRGTNFGHLCIIASRCTDASRDVQSRTGLSCLVCLVLAFIPGDKGRACCRFG